MILSPVSGRSRQLVRLLLPRLLIGFGLLLFVLNPSTPDEGLFFAWLLHLFVVMLFLLTIIHLWWLRSGRNLEMLTRIQCALDPLLVMILVILTGSFHSPFLFLNGLVILNAALLLGRREALMTAGMILILSAAALSLTTLLMNMPIEPAPVLLRGFLLHALAYLLTALLGGALAQRAAGLQLAFDRQTDSLADLAALHEQIVAAMPYGLILVNNQGVIREVNPGVYEAMGGELPSLTGRALEPLFPAFHWAVTQADGSDVYIEIPMDEHIFGVNVSFVCNYRQEQIGTLLVIRDLSFMKHLEQELAERERLALIGRMAAGMAHEIRNPLASILTAAQMFSTVDAREQRLLTIIQEEVTRLKQLTGDFLQFSRPAKPQKQKVHLYDFVTELGAQVQRDPRWGETRKLKVELSNPDLSIWFDPAHLRQILWNVFINAIQAAPDGQRVTVNIKAQATRVILAINDDGPGVDAKILPKLIEPFFTTRSNGSGLGLAVVHHLMVLNGGRLLLKNGPHGGLLVELHGERIHGGHSGL
ncbi:MAG: hypothetical protein HQL94_03280 [Magnetococcales bacterium]|nr:hypothetical protein [Magnetococcales bacterium]MBF0438096.1 hypothetical protein [Magnetococcales bacterium]